MKTIDNSKVELNPQRVARVFHPEINIDQLRMDYKKRLCVMDMIDKAVSKKRYILCSTYYKVFGNEVERQRDLIKAQAVITRLVNYLINQTRSEVSHG